MNKWIHCWVNVGFGLCLAAKGSHAGQFVDIQFTCMTTNEYHNFFEALRADLESIRPPSGYIMTASNINWDNRYIIVISGPDDFVQEGEKLIAAHERTIGALNTHGAESRCHERFRSSANKGSVTASFSLAEAYAYGFGVSQNYGKAFYWYRQAADKGLPQAQYKLGRLYELGRGTNVDASAARYWKDMAEEHGVTGENCIGDCE